MKARRRHEMSDRHEIVQPLIICAKSEGGGSSGFRAEQENMIRGPEAKYAFVCRAGKKPGYLCLGIPSEVVSKNVAQKWNTGKKNEDIHCNKTMENQDPGVADCITNDCTATRRYRAIGQHEQVERPCFSPAPPKKSLV